MSTQAAVPPVRRLLPPQNKDKRVARLPMRAR